MPAPSHVLQPLMDAGAPGVAVATAVDGLLVHEESVGDAVGWETATRRLPQSERRPVTVETLFDLASVSKLYTAVVLLRVVEEGLVGLDDPVVQVLPGLGAGDRVTLRHLLTHVSGLPAVTGWADWPDTVPARREALIATVRTSPVGVVHAYSCVGYLLAGLVAEAVTDSSLPELVKRFITEPMGLADTMHSPPTSDRARCAATEYQEAPRHGMVHGVVHDEANRLLGGGGGNAGVFATARDLLRFGEMLRGGGVDGSSGRQILTPASVLEMISQQLAPGVAAAYGQGLGLRLGSENLTGRATVQSVGHGGFTGTALVIDLDQRRTTAMLTNAVHPRRGRELGPARRESLRRLRQHR